jgi:hypothetical protein
MSLTMQTLNRSTCGTAPLSVFACAVRPLAIIVLTSAETKPAPPTHSSLRLDSDEGFVMQLQEPNSISISSCRIKSNRTCGQPSAERQQQHVDRNTTHAGEYEALDST